MKKISLLVLVVFVVVVMPSFVMAGNSEISKIVEISQYKYDKTTISYWYYRG